MTMLLCVKEEEDENKDVGKKTRKKRKKFTSTHSHTYNNINKSNNVHQKLFDNTKSIVKCTMVWDFKKTNNQPSLIDSKVNRPITNRLPMTKHFNKSFSNFLHFE
jgi:hypothetical protein